MTRMTYNFIRGLGSIFDLMPSNGPSRVGRGIDLNRTDAEALRRDWQRVAQELQAAFNQTTKEADEHGRSDQNR